MDLVTIIVIRHVSGFKLTFFICDLLIKDGDEKGSKHSLWNFKRTF